MIKALQKRFGAKTADPAPMPAFAPDLADWTGGRFHLQMRGGARGADGIPGHQNSVLLAFFSPKLMFITEPNAQQIAALTAQLSTLSHSRWAEAGIAKIAESFPAARPEVLQAIVQSGQNANGDPVQHFEVQFALNALRPGKPLLRGSLLSQSDGQTRFIL